MNATEDTVQTESRIWAIEYRFGSKSLAVLPVNNTCGSANVEAVRTDADIHWSAKSSESGLAG